MFSPIQKQAVALYLKSLENQRDVLTHALGTVNQAIEECNFCLTIKDVQKRNFLEMMQHLEEINKENLQKYSTILIDNNYIVENQHEINNSRACINERNLSNQPQSDVTADSDRFVSIEQFNLLQRKMDMAMDVIDMKCQELRNDVSTIKDRVENVELDFKSHNNAVMQYKSKVEQTDKNLQALTEQINKQNILTTMLSENMERNVNSFNDLIDSFNDKMKQMNNAIHDLNDSRNDSKKQIEILWNKVKNSHVKINDTESSLRNVSEEQLRISLYFKTFEDKYNNLDVKFLAKKFKILESIKEVLTKPSLPKGDTFVKLKPNANALASKMSDSPVAVCVTIKNNLAISPGDIIKAFENVICNVDAHFDVNKGEFTVPTSGIYFISLTLSVKKRVFDSVRIAVSCVSALNKSADLTGGTDIVEDNPIACVDCFQSTATDVSVIYLEAGEKLFLQVLKAHKSVRLTDFSSFTCFKI